MIYQYIANKIHKSSLIDLIDFIDANDIDNPVTRKDLHVTIVLSDTPLRQTVQLQEDQTINIQATVKGFEKWKTMSGNYVVVAVLECDHLQQRHQYYRTLGNASHRFDSYTPHITLSYDVDPEFDVSTLQWDNEIKITLTTEYTQELKSYE